MGRLADRVAIVTGGARGIGRAVAARLNADAARVAVLDIDERLGTETVESLHDPDAALFVACDVTSEAQVQAAVARTTDAFGSPTVLVNNAGRNAYFDARTMTERQWDEFFAVDLKAAWLCAKHVLPGMYDRGGGSIVNVSSIHALMTLPGFFPYAAAKSGLVGLTRSLAVDHGPANIRVNAVCPGVVHTPLYESFLSRSDDADATARRMAGAQPLGRIGQPEEVASLIAYLVCDEAAFITGAALSIDGGLGARFVG